MRVSPTAVFVVSVIAAAAVLMLGHLAASQIDSVPCEVCNSPAVVVQHLRPGDDEQHKQQKQHQQHEQSGGPGKAVSSSPILPASACKATRLQGCSKLSPPTSEGEVQDSMWPSAGEKMLCDPALPLPPQVQAWLSPAATPNDLETREMLCPGCNVQRDLCIAVADLHGGNSVTNAISREPEAIFRGLRELSSSVFVPLRHVLINQTLGHWVHSMCGSNRTLDAVVVWESNKHSRIEWEGDHVHPSLSPNGNTAVLMLMDDLHSTPKARMLKVRSFLSKYLPDVLATYAYSLKEIHPDHPRQRITWLPHSATDAFTGFTTINKTSEPAVLVSGAMEPYYQCRKVARGLCKTNPETFQCLGHPGYGNGLQKLQVVHYNEILRKYSFALATCEGAMYLVRKVFEIGAVGTGVLTTERFGVILQALGLSPGVHFFVVDCSNPASLLSSVQTLTNTTSTSVLERVREAGQRIFRRFHTSKQRSRVVMLRALSGALQRRGLAAERNGTHTREPFATPGVLLSEMGRCWPFESVRMGVKPQYPYYWDSSMNKLRSGNARKSSISVRDAQLPKKKRN